MNIYKIVTKLSGLIVSLVFKIEVKGLENIPFNKPFVIASNHKSNWDPALIAKAFSDTNIHFLAKKELFNNKFLGNILLKSNAIPVDRDSPSMATLKSTVRVLRNNGCIGIFPEGTRHKDINTFAPVKNGYVLMASKGDAVIVPVSICTRYRIFSKVNIVIGEPIDISSLYGKKIKATDYPHISEDVFQVIRDNYYLNMNK